MERSSLKRVKGSFKKYVRWGGEGGYWKAKKNKQEKGVLVCAYVHFFKKMLRFSKSSFIVILQFLLLIIMTVWNIKPSWKIIIFSPVNEWHAIDFASPFYFTRLFILFSALSIIFFAHFQQKWRLIDWL